MAVSEVRAYISVVLMQRHNSQEHRMLADLVVARNEEEALIKATVLSHPSGHDNWSVLSKEVKELDRETLERVAKEVLGSLPAAARGTN